MSRFTTMNPAEATGSLAQTFTSIKRAAGMIPNAYLAIGSSSPQGLEAILRVDEVVAGSAIPDEDLEMIRLMVSEWAGCDYCTAAHSLKARFHGLSREVISAIRQGNNTGNAQQDALMDFVRQIMVGRGTLSALSVSQIRLAGYSEQQLVALSLAIASTVFISTFNRINDTEIDYPQF